VKKIAFLTIGILLAVGSLLAKPSLASLEEKVARNPGNAKAVYALTRRYCEEDSAVQAVETYKRLAELDMDAASEVFIRAKVAVYLDMEPFFPHPVCDSMAMIPRLSDDANWIVFHAVKAGKLNVGTMDVMGENFRWITDDARQNLNPCFAGSKDRFIFTRKTADGQGTEIVYYNAEGGETEDVVFTDRISVLESPDWAGENAPVLFSYILPETRTGEIVMYNRKAGELSEVTQNSYTDRYPRYSQNGKLIVYVQDKKLHYDVYIMNSKGKARKRITTWIGADLAPDFGDGDRKIAFTSDRHGGGQFDIFVYDRKTGEVIPVTYHEMDDSFPDLSPDGNWLLFQSNRGDGRPRAYIVSLNQPVSAESLLAEIEAQGK
jgi:Tol biopolymer transport system component